MTFLDFARDGVRADGDFTAGIPSTGRMSAAMANHAFHTWDTGRRESKVRAALSYTRKMVPSGTGLPDPSDSRDRFRRLSSPFPDVVLYTSHTNDNLLIANDLRAAVLPSAASYTLIPAASGVAFGTGLDEVGDGRVYRRILSNDPVNYPTIVINPYSGIMTTYATVKEFLDPRIGGKKYAYIKTDNTWVATDTIGSAETPIFTGYSISYDPESPGGSMNPGTRIWIESLGLFQLHTSPFDASANALSWSRRGANEIIPVLGSAPHANDLFELGDRFITDNGLLCEDHRKGSRVNVTEYSVIGTHNGVIYTYGPGGTIGFSVSATQDSFRYIRVCADGDLYEARIVGGRLWFYIDGSTDFYFTGVLP